MRTAAVALLLAGLAGCLDVSGPQSRIDLDFDFNMHGEGWFPFATDFPVGREADIQLVGELRNLPAPIDGRAALYLAGTNISDDLFIYLRKRVTGLPPNITLQASLAVEIASPVHAGCTVGIGSSVWIKVGVTSTAPEPFDDNGYWTLNLDKGEQSAAGLFTQLGDIRNTLSGCPSPGTWGFKQTELRTQTVSLTTDNEGGFWIFLGTESGFESRHELFFSRLRLHLE
ncbi:MAG: hypothetical protein ACRENB_09320 [Gemmatimonadales bacterium]